MSIKIPVALPNLGNRQATASSRIWGAAIVRIQLSLSTRPIRRSLMDEAHCFNSVFAFDIRKSRMSLGSRFGPLGLSSIG